MKRKLLLLAVVVLVNLSAFAYNFERTVEKSFDASSISNLYLSNKYGDVELIEDDMAKDISFKYLITVECSNKDYGETRFKAINIEFSQDFKTLKAETKIDDMSNKFGFWNNNNHKLAIKIQATVRIPKKISCEFAVKYGNFITDKLSNNFKGDIKYGNANINELNGAKNSIVLKYGNLKLKNTNDLDLNVGYSGSVEIGTLKKANIESKYSQLSISSAKELSVNSKYDKYSIDDIDKINIDMGYTQCHVQKLHTSFKAGGCKYGYIGIKEIDIPFEKIDINSSYSPIDLGLTGKHSCKMDIHTPYGQIRTGNLTVNATSKGDDYMIGTIGEGSNPKSELNIRTNYSDVKLNN